MPRRRRHRSQRSLRLRDTVCQQRQQRQQRMPQRCGAPLGAFQLTCALSISLGRNRLERDTRAGGGLTAIAIGTGIGIGPWPDCSSLSRRFFAPTPRNAKRPTLRIIECPCALIAQPVGRARCLTASNSCSLLLSLL